MQLSLYPSEGIVGERNSRQLPWNLTRSFPFASHIMRYHCYTLIHLCTFSQKLPANYARGRGRHGCKKICTARKEKYNYESCKTLALGTLVSRAVIRVRSILQLFRVYMPVGRCSLMKFNAIGIIDRENAENPIWDGFVKIMDDPVFCN